MDAAEAEAEEGPMTDAAMAVLEFLQYSLADLRSLTSQGSKLHDVR